MVKEQDNITKTNWTKATDKEHYLDKGRFVYIEREWVFIDKPNLKEYKLISVKDINKYLQ